MAPAPTWWCSRATYATSSRSAGGLRCDTAPARKAQTCSTESWPSLLNRWLRFFCPTRRETVGAFARSAGSGSMRAHAPPWRGRAQEFSFPSGAGFDQGCGSSVVWLSLSLFLQFALLQLSTPNLSPWIDCTAIGAQFWRKINIVKRCNECPGGLVPLLEQPFLPAERAESTDIGERQ